MRVAISVVCVCLWATTLANSESVQKLNRNPDTNTQNEKTQTPQPAPSSKNSVQQPNVQSTQQQYDPYSDHLYRAYLWATVLGVIGGILGVAFLVVQTIATHTAANAAKASADAVRNSQRAWLFVRAENQGGGWCEWFYKNFGQTPAKVIFRSITDICVADIAELPTAPVYEEDTTPVRVRIVAPGDERGFKENYDYPFRGKPSDVVEAIRKKEKILVVYGIVRYNDVFDDSGLHETGFCYIWAPDRIAFLPGGPDSYNRNT